MGRSKEIIIRSGHNIDPLLIEEVAMQHPSVAQAAAIAMPDAYAGELPVLYAAPTPGATVEHTEILEFVNQRIAEPPARPKHVFVMPELPLTPLGKIARYRLRQDAAEHQARRALAGLGMESIHCSDNTAKRITVTWNADTSADQKANAANLLSELGLFLD
ncbi:Short-chain-fatty-acid--CoA ligase [Alcanivorax sp. ALC70]|nr:Short-chain-fatty-acid--CoA ligase [Alcanivorax sp. ALC70]